jgi:hypothetical protein
VIVAYISGHGFGHYIRAAAVLAQLRDVHLRTNARALLLARKAGWDVADVDVGPGVVQKGPLASDLPATLRACEQYLADWPRLVAEEAAFLRRSRARLVFGDVPPLAFAAAAEAGVPSVAMANFSWSWIYDAYPGFADVAAHMRRAESQASLLLELDMGGGLDVFPRRRRIAPVARPLRHARADVRTRLGVTKTMVLFSLGGYGDDFTVDLAGAGRHQVFVTSGRVPGATAIEPTDELGHHELTAAADCVIGKPGYGTVAECLRRPTPLCWLPRSDFRENQPLAEAIRRWLPNAPLTVDDLRGGRWADLVDAAIASSPREQPPAPDGAAEAAAILREF